ncbi:MULTISPECIES: HEAT repeat domain-containing protein [unclassified Kitasatospora]|uniref:HEAT repeat domain-containing protein n=1 Tax=unclassified Kitasatospora TaxID=2633591 RepID=UPI0033E1F3F0
MDTRQAVRDLGSPDATVRRAAAWALRERGDAQPAAVAQSAVPLLGDPDAEVRQAAVRVFCSWGEDVVPLLQAVRRNGPGAARAGALEALAEIGGEALIGARDLAALERLVRVKAPEDAPEPLACCFLSWIAVATGDQAGVMDLLGLSAPRPVPFAAGVYAADIDGHGGFDDDRHDAFRRVFVTPEPAGWTLVVGAWCDPSDAERAAEVLAACERLSARYGRAQAYWWSAQNDGSAVLVAEHGAAVRRFAYIPGEDTRHLELGAPLGYEQRRRAELGLPALVEGWVEPDGDDEDEWVRELLELAPRLAGELSLDPLSLGPGTPVRGAGVLALTAYGRRMRAPAGALLL